MDATDGERCAEPGVAALLVEMGELRARFAELQARLITVTGERDEYKQLAALLKRELERIRDLQKTPREHVNLGQPAAGVRPDRGGATRADPSTPSDRRQP